MVRVIRSCALAAAAAALLTAQTAYAAPATASTQPAADPLVSLSLLGTAQSRAAVCGFQASGATCGLPMTMAAATTASTAQDLPPPPPPPERRGFGALPAILAFLLLLGIAVAILSGGGDAEGNLAPISPA